MFYLVLLLLVVVPAAELWLLFRLADATNWAMTLLIVLFTGILGAALARRQGLEVYRRIREQMAQGKTPTAELLDGLMILFAGVFLITPGILTDGVGFLLLVPPVRMLLRGWLVRRLVPPGVLEVYSFASTRKGKTKGHDGEEIEAEYTVRREPAEPDESRLPNSAE